MYSIKSKVDFTGISWGLAFVEGTATTDNEALAEKLRNRGYTVVLNEKAQTKDKSFDQMKKSELEAYATTHSVDISSAKTNSDIIALLTTASTYNANSDGIPLLTN
ncbi:MAG: hypothetical protein RR576_01375 [Oscillospiraceae bacterium]